MTPRVIAVATAALLAAASSTSAQVRIGALRDAPRAGSWEAGGGVASASGFSDANRVAELTRNGEPAGGYDLFTAGGKVTHGAGAAATLALYVSRSIAIEGGLRYSRPALSYRLSADVEDAAAITAQETLTRYVVTGSILWHLRGRASSRRAIPFVLGGAGYIRDVHQGNELIETGTEFHAAGGVKYWFGAGRRRFGLRGEAGITVSDGGFDFRDKPRALPLASASLVYLF